MTNFSKTITNSLNLFERASLWNAWNWNAFKWGDGTADLPVRAQHLISESFSLDSAIAGHSAKHVISETVSLLTDIPDVEKGDGGIYSYVFPSDVTNHENESIASYTSGSNPSNSWSSASAGSTVWS